MKTLEIISNKLMIQGHKVYIEVREVNAKKDGDKLKTYQLELLLNRAI